MTAMRMWGESFACTNATPAWGCIRFSSYSAGLIMRLMAYLPGVESCTRHTLPDMHNVQPSDQRHPNSIL